MGRAGVTARPMLSSGRSEWGVGVLLFVGLACSGVLLLFVMRASPRLAFVVWCATLFFIPVWIGVSLGPFWSAITLMAGAAVVAFGRNLTLLPVDGVVTLLVFMMLAQYGLKLASLATVVTAMSEWILPYILGRLVLGRLEQPTFVDIVAVFVVVAAVLGLVEFGTHTNLFTRITGPGSVSLYETWGTLQERGGNLRVEGAFGHSIAFGATLAMGSAFILACRWKPWIKLIGLLLVTGAVAASLSRLALLTLALTVGLSLVLMPGLGRRLRVGILVLGGLGGVALLPYVTGILLAAGEEASGSADYRLDLMSLLKVVRPLGSAEDFVGLTTGGSYLGVFARSIDNAALVAALRVGWVGAILLLIVVGFAALRLLQRGGANPASIAVAAQIPSLFTVAFITQFAVAFWFLVGVAVSWPLLTPATRGSRRAKNE